MSAPIQKENPAVEAGLPGRIGDANSGLVILPSSPAVPQHPDDSCARIWFSLGYVEAVLERLEAQLGIVREAATC